MNENEILNNNTNTYKATRNLNTEIENPQMNINSVVGINIQDLPENHIPSNDTIDKYFNVNLNQPIQQSINNNFQDSNSYNNTKFNNQTYNNIEQNNYNNQTYNNMDQNNFNNNTTFINQDNYQQNETSSTTFINTDLANNVNHNSNYEETSYSSDIEEEYTSTNKMTHYQPTMQEKQKKESTKMPSELKVTIFIVLLLLLFISVMPYIFDFFKTIELTLFG